MNKITCFGKELRKLRVDNDLLLKDMADALDVSSAYLSSVELGKRSIPNGWISKLVDEYKLDKKQATILEVAALETTDTVSFSLGKGSSELALSFARKFDSLTEDEVNQMLKILKKKER